MCKKYNILFTFLFVLAYSVGAQQYNFRNFNVEDGLGQSQVYATYQDKTGKLWLGTRGGGISLFDGFKFTSYTTNDGLNDNYINAIKADSKGIVWIATNKGVCSFDGVQFTTVDLGNLESAAVRGLFITPTNDVYCASNKGVFKISKGQFELITPTSSMNTTAVWKDKNRLWIGSNEGLFSYENGNLKSWKKDVKVMGNAITTLTKGRDNKLWIGTYGDGMYCFNGNSFYRIDFHHELYRQTVLDIYIDENDNLWIATLRKGVVHYERRTKTFTDIGEAEGLSNNHVRSIIRDNNGSLWFGTSGGGISQYLGQQFTTFDEKSGLAGNFIYSVYRDMENNLWIGNSQRGVSVHTDSGFVNFNASNLFEDVKVKAISEGTDGSIWLGTDGRGVYTYRHGNFLSIPELKNTYVKQMKTDNQGRIWIATAGTGLIRISNTSDSTYQVRKWTHRNGLLSNRLTSLHIDKKDRIWYGTEGNGVGCFGPNNRNMIRWDKTNFLNSNAIRSLTSDQFGRLWIGTAGNGVNICPMYESPKQRNQVSRDNGLFSDNVYLLTTDQHGNVIVGTEKGLDYIFLGEKGNARQIKHYGRLDGFSGVETCQNSVWNDENGAIWFGTINGLCRFNPSELVENTNPPILSFKDIKLFYESILDQSENQLDYGKQVNDLLLPYHQNHITFDFLGINLKRPNGVQYRWKLEGFDPDWSPPSSDRSILYSNLNPGTYRFLLIASNEDGVWNEHPLVYKFEIETPYWRTAWFKWLVGGGIGIILLLIYIITIRRIRRKARQKQHEVELEKELLMLEQKAMRLQMNPHFIFNALNSIQSLIGTGQETEARYYLAKFSRLMRQILDNSRQTNITLQEEISSLENYLLVEQFCTGGRFNYSINVSDDMETDFINIPPMIIQPFVENSIKHGMKEREDGQQPGNITISFVEQEGVLECIIEDDGIGRKRAQELKQSSMETYHKSAGLSVTTDRLHMLDNTKQLNPLEIVDLYEDNKATGTRVIIRLPID